jgi:hypothetical protein
MDIPTPECFSVTTIAASQSLSYSGRWLDAKKQECSENRASAASEELRRYVTAGSNVTSSPPKKT